MSDDRFAAVCCPKHGLVVMDKSEYERQMNRSSAVWKCPQFETDPVGVCGRPAEFSDSFWEEQGGGYHPEDEPQSCPVCGSDMEWEECCDCGGLGGYHDCGEDTCCCLDKEEPTHDCTQCNGAGGYLECRSLPHSEEQLKAYRESK